MPCPPEPDRYCPPCGHYTCSDRATEAGCFCSDHWWMLPEYLRAQILLCRDRLECCHAKGRPHDKAFAVLIRSMRSAVTWLRGQDERELPADYQRPV